MHYHYSSYSNCSNGNPNCNFATTTVVQPQQQNHYNTARKNQLHYKTLLLPCYITTRLHYSYTGNSYSNYISKPYSSYSRGYNNISNIYSYIYTTVQLATIAATTTLDYATPHYIQQLWLT